MTDLAGYDRPAVAEPPANRESIVAASAASLWMPISTAPSDRDLELAVIDRDGAHALVFPCRRALAGWVRSATGEEMRVSPTHWREWDRDAD